MKEVFPALFEKNFLNMPDEWIDRMVDKLIASSSVKLFNFIMAEQIEFYQEIEKKIKEDGCGLEDEMNKKKEELLKKIILILKSSQWLSLEVGQL